MEVSFGSGLCVVFFLGSNCSRWGSDGLGGGEGRPVPPEAVELMAKPLMPNWIYTLFGNMGWKRQAKQYGDHKELGARPFQD